jgi:hypothetical protein
VSRPSPTSEAFRPVRVLDVELSEPLAALEPAQTTEELTFGKLRALVRLQTFPLGFVELERSEIGISAAALATGIETFPSGRWTVELARMLHRPFAYAAGRAGGHGT